jgi:hypothetical protein
LKENTKGFYNLGDARSPKEQFNTKQFAKLKQRRTGVKRRKNNFVI